MRFAKTKPEGVQIPRWDPYISKRMDQTIYALIGDGHFSAN